MQGDEDLRVAPFHVLAAESVAFAGRDHGWHLELCQCIFAVLALESEPVDPRL